MAGAKRAASAGLPSLTAAAIAGTLPGEGLATYKAARAAGKVVVVSKATCTFCARAATLLEGIVKPERLVIIDLENATDAGALRAQAKEDSGGCKTVPIVFYGDRFLGGCDSLFALDGKGELRAVLGNELEETEDDRKPRVRVRPPLVAFPLCSFPYALNGVAARFVGLQVVCCCVLAIIWREEQWTSWMMLGLSIDFLVRFVAGGTASPVGVTAAIASLPFKERLVNGPQKQFATFLGICFSGIIGALLLSDNYIPGAVVAGMLLGAAGLEAFFDFCAGCVMFSYMIKFGIVTSKANDLAISQKPLIQAQIDHADDFSGELRPLEEYKHRQPGQPETPVDLRVKARKLDDHKRRGFHPIKNVQIGDFIMPLGIAALALAWKIGVNTPALATGLTMTSNTVWQVLLWIALVLFSLLTVLLVAKLVLFPRKVWKELVHPMKSNMCATFPTSLVVFAFLIFDNPDYEVSSEVKHCSLVLFWIAAVLLKLLLVYRLAWIVGNRADSQHTQAQLLMPMASCIAAAMVAPIYDGFEGHYGYTELGWFLFGLAGVLCVVLMGGTLIEAVSYHWSDERTRPSMGMWVVALHLPFLAYMMLMRGPAAMSYPTASTLAAGSVSPLDALEHTLFFAGLSIFLVLAWLAVPMGFLIKMKFDFSFWALAFPLDILSCSTMVYFKATRDTKLEPKFAHGLAYATLALASYANAVLFLNTVFWLLKRRWLRPDVKWAPLSLNKLTHEAFRVAGRKMMTLSRALLAQLEEGGSPLALARSLAAEWEVYSVTLEWHAHQEDKIMFREIDAFNPMATRDGYRQHMELEKMEEKLNNAARRMDAVDRLNEDAVAACRSFVTTLAVYVPYMEKHMDWEEENLLAMNRRTFNMDIQIRIVRKIWDAYEAMSVEEFRVSLSSQLEQGSVTKADWDGYNLAQFRRFERYGYPDHEGDIESLLSFPPIFPEGKMPLSKQQVWRVVLPYVVRNLPEPMMRTRFVRCWTWGLPERAQHIGEMIYRGLDDAEWAAIAKDVPEIIPRGLPGWVRRV